MEQWIQDKLSEPMLRLVARIEAHVGSPILARRGLRADDASAVACSIAETGKPTLLYKREDFTGADILHELLHMERYLLEGVPQLYHKRNDVAGMFEDVEDMLEHLVIVPRECEYGVVPWPAQAEDAKRVWSTYKPSMASHPAGRIACLKGWLPVSILVKDSDVHDHIALLVKQSGLWRKAQQLSRDVVTNLQNKPRVVATFLNAAGVPLDGFRLLYFDPVNDGIRYEYVPPIAGRR